MEKYVKEIGKIRLIVLRVYYLLTAFSFGALAALDLFAGYPNLDGLQSIVKSVFCAVALLAISGVLNPLKMLPLLFLSLAWKSIWLLAFAVPMYLGDGLGALSENIMVPLFFGLVVTLAAIPWKYTAENYLKFLEKR